MITAITGGAGFIGSHFVRKLISQGQKVVVLDNFSSGKRKYIEPFCTNSDLLEIIEIDIIDTKSLIQIFNKVSRIIHLASNPDIAKAATNPRIDFVQGTCLTESVLEAARLTEVSEIIYASGSGVYGDAGSEILFENSKLMPISTYGASKLAGESLISAYSYMFGLKSTIFRFANVVGPNQTHGITYDLISKLRENPTKLQVFGDGSQNKSYLHVEDVISGVLDLSNNSIKKFEIFNLANIDNISVRDIALLAIERFGLQLDQVKLEFGNSSRGWKADVPLVYMNSDFARSKGWKTSRSSREAILEALDHRIFETKN